MDENSVSKLTQSLKSSAQQLGFALCGVTPAVEPSGYSRFSEWLDQGHSGEMHYLPDRREAYRHPDSILQDVTSIVMLGMDYATVKPAPCNSGQGRIARYAWGDTDYHDLIKSRLRELESQFFDTFKQLVQDKTLKVRTVVDTAPLLEREFAQLAGLGWFGKNTMLLNKSRGSYFFLAALLSNIELDYDPPFSASHCGTCTACLDACPTNAFPEAGVLDATRCISYLTIEHRSSIPAEFRKDIGEWFFGCDVCQEVCPWNRMTKPTRENDFQPVAQNNPVDLNELFFLSSDQLRARFKKTPVWRAKRRGILRNAAIVLGNNPSPKSIDALSNGLVDQEALVREPSAWALGQIGTKECCDLLQKQLKLETELNVQQEIKQALRRCRKDPNK